MVVVVVCARMRVCVLVYQRLMQVSSCSLR